MQAGLHVGTAYRYTFLWQVLGVIPVSSKVGYSTNVTSLFIRIFILFLCTGFFNTMITYHGIFYL